VWHGVCIKNLNESGSFKTNNEIEFMHERIRGEHAMLWILILLGLFLSVVAGIFIVTIGLSAKEGDKPNKVNDE
jgi:flagellar basal body-associated protein FliL